MLRLKYYIPQKLTLNEWNMNQRVRMLGFLSWQRHNTWNIPVCLPYNLGDLAPEILCWDIEDSIDVSTWLQINDHSNPYAYSNELLISEVLSSKIQANGQFRRGIIQQKSVWPLSISTFEESARRFLRIQHPSFCFLHCYRLRSTDRHSTNQKPSSAQLAALHRQQLLNCLRQRCSRF